VLLVDVDHFPSITDTGGYPAGDRALQQVAAVLVIAMRSDDMVARLGGDEFGVLLGGLPPEAAGVVAEAVRKRLRRWPGRGCRGRSRCRSGSPPRRGRVSTSRICCAPPTACSTAPRPPVAPWSPS
jgi:GGDEF domain-containing protein